MAILSGGDAASAFTEIEGFSKTPTFTPPPGCVGIHYAYGVLAECKKPLEPGRDFRASIDTAVGAFGSPKEFLDDQIKEIKQWWIDNYSQSAVTFSSKPSDTIPANASPGTLCADYAVTTKTNEEVQIAKGIACSWPVESPAPKKWTVEICWLEAYDAYKPSIGQKPMPSFDRIAHALILSMRL
jgi:hypothetical protein